MNSICWPTIHKDEYVDIIAPSGTFSLTDLQAIQNYLTQQGFHPRIPANILGDHPIFSHTDDIRFQQLAQALNSRDSTLIWCVRGGHGVTRIMPELIQLKKPEKQKLLVGFSDISSIHLWLNQAWQWPSLQGPTARIAALGTADTKDLATMNQLWFHGLQGYILKGLQPLNQQAITTKHLSGITAGGCLSVLQTSIGTPWQLNATNKILFLEDINEAPYRIDRSLVQLTNAGILNQTTAIIIGDLGENPIETKTMARVLQEVCEDYFTKYNLKLPVFRLSGFGHGARNKPIPFGVTAEILSKDNEIVLKFE